MRGTYSDDLLGVVVDHASDEETSEVRFRKGDCMYFNFLDCTRATTFPKIFFQAESKLRLLMLENRINLYSHYHNSHGKC